MKRTYVITLIVPVVVALAFLAVALWRGAIYSAEGRLHFSFAVLRNPRPSLDRPVTIPTDFSPEVRDLFNANLAKTKDALRKNPKDITSWFDLAIEYRMVGDYAGAADIWRYVQAMNPKEPVSLHNLGEYYFHTAKDYPAAESYYVRSIAAAPQIVQNYADLAEMYTYVYKQDTTAAPDLLKKGITAIAQPANFSLIQQLAGYYASKNDAANARTYYMQALKIAQSEHNAALAAQMRQAMSRLK